MAIILLFIFLLAALAFGSILISAPSEDQHVVDDLSTQNNPLLEENFEETAVSS